MTEGPVCYIVGAGENHGLDFVPAPGDFVIAADAGLNYLTAAGIRADRVIGDFDTLGHRPEHPDIVELCPEKDITDMYAAVREGIALGYRTFCLYCGMGGRVEHSIANLQMIAGLSKEGVTAFLFDNGNVITALTNGKLTLGAFPAGFVSVFAHSDRAEGVTIRGLKYTLENAVLTNTFPLGVSNEYTGETAEISVENGTLLIVTPKGMPF
ncbi:MAG: thiamine diphosphokinase [Clostridia bacterium]|nr:thiamine diphosphokinase [Clostridia bacterium]